MEVTVLVDGERGSDPRHKDLQCAMIDCVEQWILADCSRGVVCMHLRVNGSRRLLVGIW